MGMGATNPTGNFGAADSPAAGAAGVWPGNGASATDVGSVSAPGGGPKTSAFNHTHKGVHSVNGLFGDLLINGVATLDGIATGAAQLSALASANFTSGALAYVITVGDAFRLQQSALTVDNINVVAAAGKAGYQWVRLLQPSPSNALVVRWSVDPVNGNDENAGTGASDAASDLVALKTLQEVKRRLWGLETKQAVTVRLLNSMVASDVGTWNTKFADSALGQFIIQGQLGPVTGPGPTVIDNTIHSGTLTSAPTVPADVPTADDYEIVDTGLPVSWTASGMLAAGVLFKRTNGAARYWYPLKDLTAKTLRTTAPMAAVTQLTTWGGGAMANGDAYTAYALPQYYGQVFGVSALSIQLQQLYIQTQGDDASAWLSHLRCQVGGTDALIGSFTNCLIRATADRSIYSGGNFVTTFGGGGAIGDGTKRMFFNNGVYLSTGCWVSQGVGCKVNDKGSLQFEREWAMHDCLGIACLEAVTQWGLIGAMISTAGQGMSGKGNTGKLISVSGGGGFYYGFAGAAPPFIAGSTTDANPVQIAANNYTVANCPAVADTLLSPTVTKNTLP